MRVPVFALCFLLLSLVPLRAQTAQQVSVGTAAPLLSDDEMAATFNRISSRAARLSPMLEQVHPTEWVSKGAPDAYVAQWNSIRQQIAAIRSEMALLAQRPGRLTDTMKALFRLNAVHPAMDSLMAATRKYQNPAMADVIESVALEGTADTERVEQYALQIAGEQEQQYTVVDKEAQRCRSELARQPSRPNAEPSRANKKSQ